MLFIKQSQDKINPGKLITLSQINWTRIISDMPGKNKILGFKEERRGYSSIFGIIDTY